MSDIIFPFSKREHDVLLAQHDRGRPYIMHTTAINRHDCVTDTKDLADSQKKTGHVPVVVTDKHAPRLSQVI